MHAEEKPIRNQVIDGATSRAGKQGAEIYFTPRFEADRVPQNRAGHGETDLLDEMRGGGDRGVRADISGVGDETDSRPDRER